MRLYVNAAGQWVGTQAEAKPIGAELIEVPVDKPGLLAWLNEHRVLDTGNRGCCPYMGTDQCECDADDIGDLLGTPEATPPAAIESSREFWATTDRQCSVEEAIQGATLVQLGSYAQNVALRFAELGK